MTTRIVRLIISQTKTDPPDTPPLTYYATLIREETLGINGVPVLKTEPVFTIITHTCPNTEAKLIKRIRRQALSMARAKGIVSIKWTDSNKIWYIRPKVKQ